MMRNRFVMHSFSLMRCVSRVSIGLFQNAKRPGRRPTYLGRFVRCEGSLLFVTYVILHSSQSVARLNTSWSNNPKMGVRSKERGGFGGRDDLEETRRYRVGSRSDGRNGYGMVFEVPDDRGTSQHHSRPDRDHSRKRQRSVSPVPRNRSKERRRSRDRHSRERPRRR